ncbi:MAG: hypothetical protein KAV43_03880 [Hadesarchaea archaeon]|nr:hypothetical protein [Hadesarchaea archaeon]
MDELKTVEAFTRELEALRNYDWVKKERDELAERCSKLETRVSELKGELASLKGFKIGFVGKDLTLKQVRDEFLKAQELEIERRANEKFEVLKADLENKMPKLVYNKLIEIVEKPPWPKEIAGAIESKAGQMASEILINKERWPGWFRELYLKEVKAGVSAGLDAEFERRVEGGATERAEKKLMQLTRVEWPKYVKPKLSDLEAKIRENVIRMLRGPWSGIKCDRCGTEQEEIELTEQNISDLLSTGYVEKECDNLDCRDWRIWKHRIRIFLRDLIAAHIKG